MGRFWLLGMYMYKIHILLTLTIEVVVESSYLISLLQLETKHDKTVQNDPLSADCLISNPSTNTAPLPALTRCQLKLLNVNITGGDLWTPANGELLLPLKIHYSDTKFTKILLINQTTHTWVW